MTEEDKTPKEELSEAEALKQFEEAIAQMSVKDIVRDMMISLTSLAYRKLGLPEDQNAKYKDLDQAKQAIDSVAGLLEAITPAMEPDELSMFQTTLSNLRMAFVNAKQ